MELLIGESVVVELVIRRPLNVGVLGNSLDRIKSSSSSDWISDDDVSSFSCNRFDLFFFFFCGGEHETSIIGRLRELTFNTEFNVGVACFVIELFSAVDKDNDILLGSI